MRASRLLVAALAPAATFAQTPVSLPETAKRLYVDLRREGLQSFEADVVPDWEYILGASKAQTSDEALRLLRGIRFHLRVDKDGVAHVTHRTDQAATTPEMEKGFEQIFTGMEQMLGGFFQTWSSFMLASPFPKVGLPYKVEAEDGLQRVSYMEGTSEVLLLLAPGHRLQEVRVSTADFTSAIRPDFASTNRGLALSGYRADYRPTTGSGVTQLDVQITSTPVQGLPMPESLTLRGSYDGTPFGVRLSFKAYALALKPRKG